MYRFDQATASGVWSYGLLYFVSLTVSPAMSMSFTMDVSMLTLTVVALTIGPFHYASSPNTMTRMPMSMAVAVTEDGRNHDAK